ncbi:MAG: hypothetical protein US50_C0028G0004 [Candidatus Nomurabacteria bacterium GW2011_GWB1_37_5]|uniref:Uncharacterized protein n=1 Tax=Candidatus Nomurabacteria bacterium GW2011_GWB1_37_5 TaxID=1618742 RepID=A0A0G0H903_9BACT|nr:MAG: hypothetical protein US50_C0028G0004 [Candidatus Nomurabacteria bacterium GW2011_GWB1_37_5]
MQSASIVNVSGGVSYILLYPTKMLPMALTQVGAFGFL